MTPNTTNHYRGFPDDTSMRILKMLDLCKWPNSMTFQEIELEMFYIPRSTLRGRLNTLHRNGYIEKFSLNGERFLRYRVFPKGYGPEWRRKK